MPFAGATVTQGNDINASGSIVGTWVDASGGIHGFLAVGANFSSIDYPGAAFTSAWGINSAGQIVGNHFRHGELNVAGLLSSTREQRETVGSCAGPEFAGRLRKLL